VKFRALSHQFNDWALLGITIGGPAAWGLLSWWQWQTPSSDPVSSFIQTHHSNLLCSGAVTNIFYHQARKRGWSETKSIQNATAFGIGANLLTESITMVHNGLFDAIDMTSGGAAVIVTALLLNAMAKQQKAESVPVSKPGAQ